MPSVKAKAEWRAKNRARTRFLAKQNYYSDGGKKKAANRKRAARYRVAGREYITRAKFGRPCADCRSSFPPICMDFDHVRGKKIRDICHMTNLPIKSIQKEIDKCDLVCANCHRLRTQYRAAFCSSRTALDAVEGPQETGLDNE